MSNTLAIPTVTAALTSLVQSGVNALGVNPAPTVAPGSLDDATDGARIGVHLYRVTRNPTLSIADLPTRTAAGVLRSKPRAAVDLHYLLTFRGTNEWQTHQLLAAAAATIQGAPIVTAELITLAESEHHEVQGNDLREADEPVRFVADLLSLDEVTKLWALFAPGTFTVTIGLIAGPVLVDADLEPGAANLPVRAASVAASTPDRPVLTSVVGPDGPGAAIRLTGGPIVVGVFGTALSSRAGETVDVLVDDSPVPFHPIDDTHLTIDASSLRPGRHTVQVQRAVPPPAGSASTTQTLLTTAAVVIEVAPVLGAVNVASGPGHSATTSTGTITADLTPDVDGDDRVRLLLNSTNLTPPVALALGPHPALVVGTMVGSVHFEFHDAPSGTYRVTVEVNGVQSTPDVGAGGSYNVVQVAL